MARQFGLPDGEESDAETPQYVVDGNSNPLLITINRVTKSARNQRVSTLSTEAETDATAANATSSAPSTSGAEAANVSASGSVVTDAAVPADESVSPTNSTLSTVASTLNGSLNVEFHEEISTQDSGVNSSGSINVSDACSSTVDDNSGHNIAVDDNGGRNGAVNSGRLDPGDDGDPLLNDTSDEHNEDHISGSPRGLLDWSFVDQREGSSTPQKRKSEEPLNRDEKRRKSKESASSFAMVSEAATKLGAAMDSTLNEATANEAVVNDQYSNDEATPSPGANEASGSESDCNWYVENLPSYEYNLLESMISGYKYVMDLHTGPNAISEIKGCMEHQKCRKFNKYFSE